MRFRVFYAPLIILAIISILAALSAHAADWVLVLRDASGEYYFEMQTEKADASQIRLVRELHILNGHKEIKRFTVRAEYDCASRKKRTFQNFSHLVSGETSLESSNQPPWEDVSRDPVSQALFSAACSRK